MLKPHEISRALGQLPWLDRPLRLAFSAYEASARTTLEALLLADRMLGSRERTDEVRSVLHVSILSHKPYMLSRLMRQHGLRSDYLAVHAEAGWLKLGERGYDHNIPYNVATWVGRPFVQLHTLWHRMRKFDVIHYHFGSLVTDDARELDYLRRLGKLIVFHFRGCDLRQKSVNLGKNPQLNCCAECDYPPNSCETELQLRRIRLAKKYADLLFVTTPDLLDFLPEAQVIPFVAPLGIDLDTIEAVSRSAEGFRIVTSSNHDGVDGTPYIRRAVDRLRSEGANIELVEVHNTPYEKALAIYKSADLFVGKLRMGYYNNANIECMAMGVPCMSHIRDSFRQEIPDCPIIETRPETVYENIQKHLADRDQLRAIGARGPAFVAKHHDPDRVADILLKTYNRAWRQKAAR